MHFLELVYLFSKCLVQNSAVRWGICRSWHVSLNLFSSFHITSVISRPRNICCHSFGQDLRLWTLKDVFQEAILHSRLRAFLYGESVLLITCDVFFVQGLLFALPLYTSWLSYPLMSDLCRFVVANLQLQIKTGRSIRTDFIYRTVWAQQVQVVFF